MSNHAHLFVGLLLLVMLISDLVVCYCIPRTVHYRPMDRNESPLGASSVSSPIVVPDV